MNDSTVTAAKTLVVLLVLTSAAGATEFFVKQDGTGPGGYTNIQSALNAARADVDGAHTITILDSANYDESVVSGNANPYPSTNDFFTFRAAPGQSPKLYAYSHNQLRGCGLAFYNLTFDSRIHWPGNGFTNDGAIYYRPSLNPNFAEPLHIENCVFQGGSNWISAYGVTVRIGYAGKRAMIVSNRFDISEAPAKGRGVDVYAGDNKADMFIVSNYFHGYDGVYDYNGAAVSFRRDIRYNVFDSMFHGSFYHRSVPDPTNTFIVHNTFHKGASNDQFNSGAIFVRWTDSSTPNDIGLTAMDNLFYGSGTNSANYDGLYFYMTTPTNSSISFNGFCNMRQVGGIDRPACWSNYVWRTIGEVNAIPGCSNNVVNNTDPFVDAAHGDFRLKPGSWALTAGSDGGYIGALGTLSKPGSGTFVLLR